LRRLIVIPIQHRERERAALASGADGLVCAM
jgi:hypothetical protein